MERFPTVAPGVGGEGESKFMFKWLYIYLNIYIYIYLAVPSINNLYNCHKSSDS